MTLGTHIDLTGQTFGRLTVIAPNGRRDSSPHYRCRCECGGEANVRAASLRSGRTKSCGCLRDEARKANGSSTFIDLTGQTFGRLTVLSLVTKKPKTRWRCKCVCGNETEVLANNLRQGRTRSCGCLNMEIRAAHQPQLGRRPGISSWRARQLEIGDSTCR